MISSFLHPDLESVFGSCDALHSKGVAQLMSGTCRFPSSSSSELFSPKRPQRSQEFPCGHNMMHMMLLDLVAQKHPSAISLIDSLMPDRADRAGSQRDGGT